MVQQHLELTSEESTVLVEVLTSTLGDLRAEIADTDNSHFKAMLKDREQVLTSLLRRFEGTQQQ